jgi:hypothetical protein
VLYIIEQNYTLYLNTRGELRYLAHAGNRVIENQPVLSGLGEITLTATPILSRAVYALEAKITLPSLTTREAAFVSRLERLDYLHFLLNNL